MAAELYEDPLLLKQDISDDAHFFFKAVDPLQEPATVAIRYFERLLTISAIYQHVSERVTLLDILGTLRRY